jgi:hypothetical protein
MKEHPIDLDIKVEEKDILLYFTRAGEQLLWVRLKPMQAKQWANTIDEAVGIWKDRLLKDVGE